jgi:RNA polymerase sigma-70 factor (ECF subfamily)
MSANDKGQRFHSLIMPHLSEALSLARWLTKNRADAEDIVQEACLRAFRSLDHLDKGSPRAWLLAIVRNTAFTWLQKNRRTDTIPIDDETGMSSSHLSADLALNPEAELIAKADAAELEAAIEALPMEFREALVLRDIQGLEYREIARVAGVPVGTVMSRLSRARRQLMAAIGGRHAKSQEP